MSLAKGIIDKIVDENYTIPSWVLTTFKDNSGDLVNHPDNTDLRIITSDVGSLISSVNSISFIGGGDLPERATQGNIILQCFFCCNELKNITLIGILLTLENLPMYGLALIFTDAPTKDVNLVAQIIELRNRKKIKIFVALAPEYVGTIGDESWVAYETISEGRIFNMADFNKTAFVSEVVFVVGENCVENNNCIPPTTLGILFFSHCHNRHQYLNPSLYPKIWNLEVLFQV